MHEKIWAGNTAISTDIVLGFILNTLFTGYLLISESNLHGVTVIFWSLQTLTKCCLVGCQINILATLMKSYAGYCDSWI